MWEEKGVIAPLPIPAMYAWKKNKFNASNGQQLVVDVNHKDVKERKIFKWRGVSSIVVSMVTIPN